jgi:hypothetical protein
MKAQGGAMELKLDYGYKVNDVVDYLQQYKDKVSHLVVLHTDVRPSMSFSSRLSNQTLDKVRQRIRWFNNRFNQRLYGKTAIKHPSSRPLIIPTIEGIKDNGDKELTCHINLAIGHLPKWLKSDDQLKSIIEQCWLGAGGLNIYNNRKLYKLSSKHLFIEPVKSLSDAENWISYINKEGIESWDATNTQLPKIHK